MRAVSAIRPDEPAILAVLNGATTTPYSIVSFDIIAV
jgi:hypothetical protein